MGDNIGGISQGSGAIFEWVNLGGHLGISAKGQDIIVSAVDVVRCEFKGQASVEGRVVSAAPSDQLKSLVINRFPAIISLELGMPGSQLGRSVLSLVVSKGTWVVRVDKLPCRDQIIADGQWYPLLEDNIRQISDYLEQHKIEGLGIISLRKALDLMLSEFEYLTVSCIESVGDNSDFDESFADLQDILKQSSFSATLYPYQRTGVTWLHSIAEEGLGCILADEMGLGKTVQIIALLTVFKEKWGLPCLVITPATLLENWRREFQKFSERMNVLVHAGSKRTGFPSTIKKYDVIVTSYDTAVRDQGMFGMLEFGFVILDEAQAIKNPDTRRAIAIKTLNRRISIAVTGTPVENSLSDLWGLMDFACRGLLGTKEQFESGFQDDDSSAKRVERIVSPLMLRRLVKEVANDLPEKIIISQAISMSEFESIEYDALRQKIVVEYGDSATFVSLIRLRQLCCHPFLIEKGSTESITFRSSKYTRLTEILEEIVTAGQKAIIFTSFSDMSDLLASDLPTRFPIWCSQIDGRTEVARRQGILDEFTAVSGAAVLILNPRAAGTGLNITAANHVIHYNLEWNPAVEDQATARAYRRGQELPVTVHRLFYSSSVEEVMDDRIEFKRQLADTAVIGTDAKELDAADISRALTLSPVLRDNMSDLI